MVDALEAIKEQQGKEAAVQAAYADLGKRLGVVFGLVQLPMGVDESPLTMWSSDDAERLSDSGIHFITSILAELNVAVSVAYFLMEDDGELWDALNGAAFMARGLLANDLPKPASSHYAFHSLANSIEPTMERVRLTRELQAKEVSHV